MLKSLYVCRESAEKMAQRWRCEAIARAREVLPEAVGPQITNMVRDSGFMAISIQKFKLQISMAKQAPNRKSKSSVILLFVCGLWFVISLLVFME